MANAFALDLTVLDLVGKDADGILNNLTTNDVKSLAEGESCETFLTDVRGKTLAHVQATRIDGGFRLVGPAGLVDVISGHIDRYTICEDATPRDRAADSKCVVVAPDAVDACSTPSLQSAIQFSVDVSWLGERTRVLLVDDLAPIAEVFEGKLGDEAAFHQARILANFPWYGIDLSDKNLPQEANRIERTICFTKGCYLGQETVARLDALGQVQKQLVRWETRGAIPASGAEVSFDEKIVGRLTSVVPTGDDTAIAIGMTRRSHFDAGSTATGEGFEATVIA
ncbi:MAG: aminomethyltransferase [Planctomycetota bacterium]